MSEDEVKKAIEKGKLPIIFADKIGIAFCVIGISFFIVLGIKSAGDPDFQNISGMFIFLSFAILLMIFFIWQIFHHKTLTPYLSSLAIKKKEEVIENLVKEPYVTSTNRQDNYCRLYLTEDRLFGDYAIIIIYDGDGYYLNSINRPYSRSSSLSSMESEDMIERIKKLEAEL